MSLPDVFQYSDLVVATTSYTYATGAFILTIDSVEASAVSATATVMDGYQIKVVVVSPK